MSKVRRAKLQSDAEWKSLQDTLDPRTGNEAVASILKQLRAAGVVSALIEEEYLDRDFTAAYSAFYSTVFKRHTKLCRRLHFFKEDVSGLIDNAAAHASAMRLQEAGARSYVGFIVARPTPHAPLGRVVLAAPPAPLDTRTELFVKATYEAHILGATLKIAGIAMTQQDSRIGACAQAAIWTAGRHFHMRRRGPWFSTVAITSAAVQLTDNYLSRSLPAGSEFLTPDNMLRALRAMDREPLVYAADKIERPAPADPWVVRWSQVRPQDVISRYVDSGIPVVLGLAALPNQNVGHAVVVTGQCFTKLLAGTALPPEPTTAVFSKDFLVHDDQRGSNILFAVDAARATPESPHSITGHLAYLIVPLPKKVFIPAEHAEKISWDALKQYQADWPGHKRLKGAALGASVALGDRAVAALTAGHLIARTYLTYGWRYKERMIRNSIAEDFKNFLFYHDLPRHVWVTEFGAFDSLNHLDPRDQRILAHSVIDATASVHWESRCIFHAPGMGVRWFHDPTDPSGHLKDSTIAIPDDREYQPKVRGA